MKFERKFSKEVSSVGPFVSSVKEMKMKFEQKGDTLRIPMKNFSRIYFSGFIQFINEYGGWEDILISKDDESYSFKFGINNKETIKIVTVFSVVTLILIMVTIFFNSDEKLEVLVGWVIIIAMFIVFLSIMHTLFYIRLVCLFKKIDNKVQSYLDG